VANMTTKQVKAVQQGRQQRARHVMTCPPTAVHEQVNGYRMNMQGYRQLRYLLLPPGIGKRLAVATMSCSRASEADRL
jgi:hypothetical protein